MPGLSRNGLAATAREHGETVKLRHVALWLALVAAPLGAQGVRITGTTTVDYVDVQPLVIDSVLASSTSDSGLLRTTADGIIVECVGADPYCRFYRSASRVSTGPLMQDVELSGWGLGTGISIYAHGRVLKKVSSDILIDELFFEIDRWIAEGMHRPKRLKMAKPGALAMAEMSAIPLE